MAAVAAAGRHGGEQGVDRAVAVAPDGIAYAVDADPGTLDELKEAADERSVSTLKPVLTRRDRLELPEPVDLLFVSATYHHLRNPVDYFAAARLMLRPAGRVAILESRLEGLLARERVTFYNGIDPTRPSLHFGNLVLLVTMRRLQLAGHRPIGLVGGATGLVSAFGISPEVADKNYFVD